VRRTADPPGAVPELLDELGCLASALLAKGPVARPDTDVPDLDVPILSGMTSPSPAEGVVGFELRSTEDAVP
jgi:hypothetical protein